MFFYVYSFLSQFVDLSRFYIASDNELMIDILKGEINFLKSAWQNLLGRPLVTLVLKNIHLGRLLFLRDRESHLHISHTIICIIMVVFHCLPVFFLLRYRVCL